MPLISFIIPVLHLRRPKNKKRLFMPRYAIGEVLRDLHENVTVDHEVIVVCNSREPELVEFITSHEHVDKYCLNSVNVGVARAWNMGAELAEGDVLCFVNDDVQVGKGAVELLLDVLKSDGSIGEVGPRGGTWRGHSGEYVTADKPTEVDQISGFFFMLRAETYRKTGGFDVTYSPAGFEEIDMSFMVRRIGQKCVVVPHLPIQHYHHHGISAQECEIAYLGKSIGTRELHERNMRYFLKKWGFPEQP